MRTQSFPKVFLPAMILLVVSLATVWHFPNTVTAAGLLLLVSAAWALPAFGLWRDREAAGRTDKGFPPELAGHAESMALLDKATDEIRTQFGSLQAELGQVRDIQGDAIAGLVEAFTGLEAESHQQEQLVRTMLERVSGHTDTEAGGKAYRGEAAELVQLFVDNIQAMGSGSMDLVNAMNELSSQIGKIEDLLSEIDGISARTNLLALNAAIEAARAGEAGRGFAVVADEVRSLSQRSNEFSRQIRGQFTESKATMERASEIVGRMASLDMRLTLTSKDRIPEMMAEIDQLNQDIATQLSDVSDASVRISENVATAVRSLQFEDMTKQLLGLMETRLVSVTALSSAAQDFHQLLTSENTGALPQCATRLQGLLDEANRAAEVANGRPIEQQDMGTGDVELF